MLREPTGVNGARSAPPSILQGRVMTTDRNSTKARFVCALTGREHARKDVVRLDALHPAVQERIRHDHADIAADAVVAKSEAARYRLLHVQELLRDERGELSEIERNVAQSLASQERLVRNVEETLESNLTLGDRLSDKLAALGGSWAFLVGFAVVLAIWMGYNWWQGGREAFDPYPFILLNLVLSTLAAVQAPIIMMSQKRQEAKDRVRSLNDYQVNLKAELEIRQLHEKIDHLISRQWQRLAEIQELQLEIMQERRK